MAKVLEGFVDDGRGDPVADLPAVASRLSDGVVVDTTITDADGHWLFTGLPTADEYVVTLTDPSGNAVARAPWSGELRSAWVRDRLDVAGKPVLLDPAAGNSLLWTAAGLYVATGLTQAAADLLYEPLDSAYTKAEADARYPKLTDLDPYPQYLTPLEATGLYEPLDSAYTKAEADARYEPIDTMYTKAEDDARFVNLAGGSVMTGLLGPTTTNTRDLGTTALRWRKLWAVDAEFTNAPTVGGAALLTATAADALFLTPTEGNAAYAALVHNHDATYVQLTGGSVMTGLLGPSTTNTRDLGTTALRWRALYGMTGDFTTSLTVASKTVGVSATGGNTLTWNADGFYVAAGAVTDIWVDVLGDTMTGVLNMAANILPTTTNTRDLGSTTLRWRKLWAVDGEFTNTPTVGGVALPTFTTADAAYVNATSDTMSGTLGVGGLLTASAGLAVTGAATISTTLSVNSRPVIMAGCRVTHNAAQSITSATPTALAFNTERFDTDAFHDTVTNNNRLTVPAGLAGKYHIWAQVEWAAKADATIRQVLIRLNGTATNLVMRTDLNLNTVSYNLPQPLATVYDLAAGDYVEVVVRQDSGAALNVANTANYGCEFGLQRIG